MNIRTFALIALGVAALPAVAQNCAAYIVSDLHSVSKSHDEYRRFHEATCTADIGSRQAASSAGVKAGIPLPVGENILSLNLDGHSSSSNFEQWKSSYCKVGGSDDRISSSLQVYSKTLSAASADVAKACINSEPVYAYFDVSPSGQSFIFSFKVQGQETLLNASVDSEGNVKCSSPRNPFGLGNNRNISGQRHNMTCPWDGRSDVRVSLNLKNQGTRTYVLSAPQKVEPYKPVPVPVPVAQRNCQPADMIVAEMYRKVLGREVDPAGANTFGGNIRAGGKVKDAVGALLQSEEYKNKFIRIHNTNRLQMTAMLTTVFPGKVDEPLIVSYVALMGGANFDQIVFHLVNSQEYARLVGHNVVPGSTFEYCG